MAGPQPPSTSAGLLARLAVPGDNEAWRGFLEGYRPCLTAWGLRLGLQPHDADEVTGQVLLSLWKAMRGFCYDPAKSFSGYLQCVVRNHAATYTDAGDPRLVEKDCRFERAPFTDFGPRKK